MGGQSGHSAFRMLTHAELCQPQGFPVVGLGDHRVTGTVIHWTSCECSALGLPGS